MPPRALSEEEQRQIRTIYGRILDKAMECHKRSKVHGMQEIIADDAGLKTSAAVSKWNKGLSMPSESTLRRLAERYGVSTAWLSGYKDNKDLVFQAGSTDEARELRLAALEVVERVLDRLYPDAPMPLTLKLAGRAMDILENGGTRDTAFGIVFQEAGDAIDALRARGGESQADH